MWAWLTVKNLDEKIDNAESTYRQILASTFGKTNHFYNKNGEQIRGFHTPERKFHHVHPLLEKYL